MNEWVHRDPSVGRAVEALDHVRLPPRRPEGHKEWFHFCVSHPEVDVLVNFSVAWESDREDGVGGAWVPRVTLLARRDRWVGEVRTFPWQEGTARLGELGMRMGACGFRWHDGAFRVSARGATSGIEVELVLRAEDTPAAVLNVPMGSGRPLHWVLVPRLAATGTIRVDGRTLVVHDAPAYHDHNWGRFTWGGDFTWEWGYCHGDAEGAPLSLTFSRMSDRARNVVRRQGLLVWIDGVQRRVFRGSALRFESSGRLRPVGVKKVPGVLGLAHPAGATDVPSRWGVHARDADDVLDVELVPVDVAQVLVPREDRHGVTVIQEVACRVRATGRVGGLPLSVDGTTVVEMLRG